MRKIVSVTLLLVIAVIQLSIESCTPEACFEETESFLKATFYNNATGKSAAPDSVTLYGIGHKSVLIYNKSTGVQPAQFPLNSASDTSLFVIRINGTDDTIGFIYTSYPHLVSRECGFTFYHRLVDSVFYTKHNINYIYQGNNNVTTANEENIRIFY